MNVTDTPIVVYFFVCSCITAKHVTKFGRLTFGDSVTPRSVRKKKELETGSS